MRNFTIWILSGLLLLSSSAFASKQFSNTFFFGDSLTDAGNTPVNGGLTSPVVDSGAQMWSQIFASRLGSNGNASSSTGGNNWAQSGATTTNAVTQVRDYLSANGGNADKKALYSYWAGGNDMFGVLLSVSSATVISTALANTATAIDTLRNAGARYILVSNIPDSGASLYGIQLGSTASAALTAVTNAYNSSLRAQLNNLSYDVVQVDQIGAFREILGNPTRFGFTNTTSFLPAGCTGSCADAYLYYVSVHPTAAGQRIYADVNSSYIQAAANAGVLAQASTSALRTTNSSYKQQILTFHSKLDPPVDHPNFFFSGSYDKNSSGAIDTRSSKFSGNNNAVSASIDEQINQNTLVGAGFSLGSNQVSFKDLTTGANGGSFKLLSTLFSVFGSYQVNHIFFDGIANVSSNNYESISRIIPLGISSDTVRGRTGGLTTGIDLTTGYLFDKDQFKIGPMAEVNYQNIRVDAYTESNDSATALRYFGQTYNSLITSAGWQANYLNHAGNTKLVGFADILGNYQWRDNNIIRFGTVSLANSHGALPVTGPSGWMYSTDIGLTAQFASGMSLTGGYTGTFANNNRTDHIINLTVGWLL